MPVYEYRCTKCHHEFDESQHVGAPAPACPRCGRPTRRVYSSVGLIFKGSGFHTTDYRKPAPSEDTPSKPASKDGSGAKDAGAKDAGPKDAGTKGAGARDTGAKDGSGSGDATKPTSGT